MQMEIIRHVEDIANNEKTVYLKVPLTHGKGCVNKSEFETMLYAWFGNFGRGMCYLSPNHSELEDILIRIEKKNTQPIDPNALARMIKGTLGKPILSDDLCNTSLSQWQTVRCKTADGGSPDDMNSDNVAQRKVKDHDNYSFATKMKENGGTFAIVLDGVRAETTRTIQKTLGRGNVHVMIPNNNPEHYQLLRDMVKADINLSKIATVVFGELIDLFAGKDLDPEKVRFVRADFNSSFNQSKIELIRQILQMVPENKTCVLSITASARTGNARTTRIMKRAVIKRSGVPLTAREKKQLTHHFPCVLMGVFEAFPNIQIETTDMKRYQTTGKALMSTMMITYTKRSSSIPQDTIKTTCQGSFKRVGAKRSRSKRASDCLHSSPNKRPKRARRAATRPIQEGDVCYLLTSCQAASNPCSRVTRMAPVRVMKTHGMTSTVQFTTRNKCNISSSWEPIQVQNQSLSSTPSQALV